MNTGRTSRSRSAATAMAAIVAAGMTFTSTLTQAEEATELVAPATPANDEKSNADGQAQTGMAASMYFTDEFGNRREPTAEEIKQAAEAFQRDLGRLAGRHKDKPILRSRSDGTVSATVAVSKLAFLTVQETDEGELIYGHSSIDEDGNVRFASPNALPEK